MKRTGFVETPIYYDVCRDLAMKPGRLKELATPPASTEVTLPDTRWRPEVTTPVYYPPEPKRRTIRVRSKREDKP